MSFGKVLDLTKLGTSDLTAKARKYLKDRGISEAAWRCNNLRSLTRQETAALFGSYCAYESLLIPYSKKYGTARIFGLPREKGKFRTMRGEGSRVYRPVRPPGIKRQKLSRLLLVEGPIKALSCVANGFDAIGISGAWNWQKDRTAIPELQEIKWPQKKVVPIFDADVTDNSLVGQAYLALGDWLMEERASVYFIEITPIAGRKTGVDDYLAQRGPDKLRKHIKLFGEEWHVSKSVAKLRTDVMRHTEGGLAQRFLLDHSDRILYDPVEDTWHVYDGVLWKRQPKSLPDIQQLMKDTVVRIWVEAQRVKNADSRKDRTRWAAKCDNRHTIKGAIVLAGSSPLIRTSFEEFDAEPDIIGTQNGVLSLKTGKLVPSARRQRVSRRLGAPFVRDAICPSWLKFLDQIMLGRADLIQFLQDLAGYCLISGNPHRYVFFLYGRGKNGKSAFMETLKCLMGEYSVAAQSALLMKARGGAFERNAESAQPFLKQLRGMRYITVDEVPEGATLDGAVVKRLASNDVIAVRGLYSEPVEFVVEGKILVRCNHRPKIDTDDIALWDRIVSVPFDYRVPPDSEDRTLMRRLRSELSGILNWALVGAMRFYEKGGLELPESVKEQTNDYRAAMDSVTRWITENLEVEHKAMAKRSMVYGSYALWCEEQSKTGVRVFADSKKRFNERLEEMGYRKAKNKDGDWCWKGVTLA